MRLTHCGVVGHPAGHSLSPTIHREAYRLLELDDWRYELHDVAPADYVDFVATRDATWRGLSVTMPHKEATAHLGEQDADVALTGVANTLVWHDDGRLTCHNTDIAGFVAAIVGATWTPTFATVLGAGATARSAVVALARLGCESIEVKARSREKAEKFVDWASVEVPLAEVADPIDLTEPIRFADRGYHVGTWGGPQDTRSELIISTLPHDAAAPLVESLQLDADGVLSTLFDVSYDPWPTPLAAAALESGLHVLDGLDLLVHQAVEQVRLMTGRTVDAAPLLSAARSELRRRAGA